MMSFTFGTVPCSYILVSVNNGSFQLVDEDFAFDEVPEVDEMIAENLIRSRGSINEYYDIFKQRQPQKYASLIDAYRRKNYDVLSEFGLPTAPGPNGWVTTLYLSSPDQCRLSVILKYLYFTLTQFFNNFNKILIFISI